MKTAKINETNNTVEIDGITFKIGEEVDQKTPEERFWELLGDFTTHTDWKEYPGVVFIKNGEGDIIMEFKQKIRKLNISYQDILYFLEREFSFKEQEVKDLIKSEVEEHFDLKGVTPEFLTKSMIPSPFF